MHISFKTTSSSAHQHVYEKMQFIPLTNMHTGTDFYSSLFVCQSCVTEHTLVSHCPNYDMIHEKRRQRIHINISSIIYTIIEFISSFIHHYKQGNSRHLLVIISNVYLVIIQRHITIFFQH